MKSIKNLVREWKYLNRLKDFDEIKNTWIVS